DRLQRRRKGTDAGGQGGIGRQHGGAVAAGEVNRAGVSRERGVGGILRGDGETQGGVGGDGGWRGYAEMRQRRYAGRKDPGCSRAAIVAGTAGRDGVAVRRDCDGPSELRSGGQTGRRTGSVYAATTRE